MLPKRHVLAQHYEMSWPGVNFINVLQAAFMHADPESAKKLATWLSFFDILGSGYVKAAHRTLLKLTPGFNFIYILWAAFVEVDLH